MPIYKGSQKIKDIYFGKTKIGKIYKGSTLVYASTVPDTDFLKQPDFSTAESIQDGIASSFTLGDKIGYVQRCNNCRGCLFSNTRAINASVY